MVELGTAYLIKSKLYALVISNPIRSGVHQREIVDYVTVTYWK